MLKDGEWSRLYKAMQHRWASHTWPTAKVTLGMKGTNRKNVFQSKKEGVSFCRRRRTLWKGTKLFRCEVKTAELTYRNVWLAESEHEDVFQAVAEKVLAEQQSQLGKPVTFELRRLGC